MTLFALAHGYLFIANKKVASTTIQNLLYPYADVVYYRPRRGKHLSLAQARQQMDAWGVKEPEACFSYGVVRDPVDWLESWYKFRQRQGLKRKGHPSRARSIPPDCGLLDFAEEAVADCSVLFARVGNQADYFKNESGVIDIDYLARYDNIVSDLQPLMALPGLAPLALLSHQRYNESPTRADVSNIDRELRNRVNQKFAEDTELFSALARGKYRSLPEANVNQRPRRLRLDAEQLDEDLASRLVMAFQNGKYVEAITYARTIPTQRLKQLEVNHIVQSLRKRGYKL